MPIPPFNSSPESDPHVRRQNILRNLRRKLVESLWHHLVGALDTGYFSDPSNAASQRR